MTLASVLLKYCHCAKVEAGVENPCRHQARKHACMRIMHEMNSNTFAAAAELPRNLTRTCINMKNSRNVKGEGVGVGEGEGRGRAAFKPT
jgi:hypothetical protein